MLPIASMATLFEVAAAAAHEQAPAGAGAGGSILLPLLIALVAIGVSVALLLSLKQEPKIRGVEIKRTENSVVIRNARFLVLVETPWEGATTIPAVFEQSCKRRPTLPALGTRPLVRVDHVTSSDGRTFEKQTLGPYSWLSYSEALSRVTRIGSGLAASGHVRGERMAIYAETSAEWFLALQGALRQGFVVVTVYASLGDDAIAHALSETSCTTVCCDTKLAPKIIKLQAKLPSVRRLVLLETRGLAAPAAPVAGAAAAEAAGAAAAVAGAAAEGAAAVRGQAPASWEVLSLGEVEGRGREGAEGEGEKVLPGDLAVIMYTSGSTGMPKGVMMSHANVVATAAAVPPIVPGLSESDCYLAYLPLAHILEMVAEITVLSAGGQVGFGSPLTLADSGAKLQKGCKGDASTLRPTILACVPAILDRLREGVLKQVNAKSPEVRQLFDFAFKRRLAALESGSHGGPASFLAALEARLWDALVFARIRAGVGGRLRGMLSGGAPLSRDSQRFMNVALGVPVGQGYGLTETCAGGTFSEWDDAAVGRVGPPLPCSLIKLVDWEEGGYRVSDKPMSRGEVVIGGYNVTPGYFNNPSLTAESYEEADGLRWFRTGDIGQVHPDGCIEIIDRKKDIVKLQHGEYVSLGKVEAALVASPYVANLMVHADPFHSFPVAIVSVNVPVLEQWAKENSVAHESAADLCAKKEAMEEVLRSFGEPAKQAKLNKGEMPARLKLLSEPWTPESGLVTAALKLKRESVRAHYKADLIELYQ